MITHFFADGSSSIGFPDMGYLNYHRRRGALFSALIPLKPTSYHEKVKLMWPYVLFLPLNEEFTVPDSLDDRGHTSSLFISLYDMYLLW